MIYYIGTPSITRPNAFGETVKETTHLLMLKIVELDFTPKTGRSGNMTHVFTRGEREWFTAGQMGRELTFRKATGKEVGGTSFIL